MTTKERLIDMIETMPDEKIEQVYTFVVSIDKGETRFNGATKEERLASLRRLRGSLASDTDDSSPRDVLIESLAERFGPIDMSALNDDVPDGPRRGVLGPPRRPRSRDRSPKGPMFPLKDGETVIDVLDRLRGALVDDGRSYEELRDEIIEERYGSSYRH